MKSELVEEIFQLVEARSQSRPTPMEFEMAYQARVAMDRIRFAIKHAEQFGPQTEPMREAGLQLLDALQRLETADRRFQTRCHMAEQSWSGKRASTPEAVDGRLLAVGGSYAFRPRALHNLLADDFIRDHSAVKGPEVAYAVLSAIGAS